MVVAFTTTYAISV